MSAQNAEHLTRIVSDRVSSYPMIALYSVVGFGGNLVIVLAYGPSASAAGKVAILLSIVAVALLASLPARSLFQDIAALREDVASSGGSGAYGRELASKPIPLFINLTLGFNALIAAAQIWALYSS